MAINILDNLLINRISAGEVVESPFSIVKELIDNSIDACADKIEISIKAGGIDQIIVKDNGKGIDYDDIIKAFLPHATSKIKDLEDLDNIMTLGFRGEALASISNVAQTSLSTKTKNSDCAFKLEVNGGKFGEIEATSQGDGTKIEVNNLFFNTPARRKFLRKPKTEETQITNVVARYILANPTISFKYTVDDELVYQTKGKTLLDAISCVYGIDITQNLTYIESEKDNIKVSGYVSKIGFSKPNTTYQTLILNNRYVIDEIVSKAVYMANEEYLMPRQFPMYILNITMPSINVDVNVHPNKMAVKFANPSEIYNLVYSAVKSKIYEQLNPTSITQIKEDIAVEESLIKVDLSSLKEIEVSPIENITPSQEVTFTFKQPTYSPVTIFDLPKVESKLTNNSNQNTEKTEHLQDVYKLADFKIVGEIFNEFIILEKGDNMILLDFHAGHERLNYDKFVAMVESKDLVVQDLLIPYTQTLTERELDYILNMKEDLKVLGFDVDEFGDKTIIINSIPLQLKDINLKAFVDDLLHDIKTPKPNIDNQLKHYLMQKACKSSVKSGMTLSTHEIQELLKNLDEKHPVLLCPHGRPIISVISKSKLEKDFKRIV